MSSKINREALRNLLYGLVNDPESVEQKEEDTYKLDNIDLHKADNDNILIEDEKKEVINNISIHSQKGTSKSTFKGISKAL